MAFTAEFLAPADLLREAIHGDALDVNDLEALAGLFGVSPYLIEHQVENQKLARVVSTLANHKDYGHKDGDCQVFELS